MTEKKVHSKIVIVGIVGLMLIVFPIICVYMSSSGLQRYKKLNKELVLYGDSIIIPNTILSTQSGQTINTASLNGKIVVAHFYDASCTDCQAIWEELKRVQSEFIEKARKRVALVSYSIKSDSIQALMAQIKTMEIDTTTWSFVTADSSKMAELIQQGYKIEAAKANYTIALLHTNGMLVNHYDLREKAQANKMMEHIALIIPAKKDRRRIKYQQEKELYK